MFTFDNSVENSAIIISLQTELNKIPAGFGSFFWPQLNLYFSRWSNEKNLLWLSENSCKWYLWKAVMVAKEFFITFILTTLKKIISNGITNKNLE